MTFSGYPTALSSQSLSTAALELGIKAAEIWSVFAVETSGCGFWPDRTPQILYERHIFWRCTNGSFPNSQDISNPIPGGYGPTGRAQYEKLERAITLNARAALEGTSWGLGQILGMNYQAAGFTSVEDMVAAMVRSEDCQLLAFSRFLQTKELDRALQMHDWTAFARGYNGPNYVQNRYDTRLRTEYLRYSSGALPDLELRAAQLYLSFLGYEPGTVDGLMGKHTSDALCLFQQNAHLPISGIADDATISKLRAKATSAS